MISATKPFVVLNLKKPLTLDEFLKTQIGTTYHKEALRRAIQNYVDTHTWSELLGIPQFELNGIKLEWKEI